MIDTLFPREVVTVTATTEMVSGSLYPAEEACIARAVLKRRREFASGRLCARQALARVGVTDFPLLVGADRAPIWPPGIVGSISHSGGLCGVAVARQGDVISIGVDVEQREPLKHELVRLICTPAEIAQLDRLASVAGVDWAKMIFSAKESTYKCYHPIAKTFLEFHEVEIVLAPEDGRFSARLLATSTPSANGARLFHGKFAYDTTHIATGVTLTARECAQETSRQS